MANFQAKKQVAVTDILSPELLKATKDGLLNASNAVAGIEAPAAEDVSIEPPAPEVKPEAKRFHASWTAGPDMEHVRTCTLPEMLAKIAKEMDEVDAKAFALSVACWPNRYLNDDGWVQRGKMSTPSEIGRTVNHAEVCNFFDPTVLDPKATKSPAWQSSKTSTPWGTADSAYVYARGVIRYNTPGHGGFHLSATRDAKVPEPLRASKWNNKEGWYEEDCDWAIVAVTFPELFKSEHVVMAHDRVKSYYPHAYEAAFGIKVKEDESVELQKEAAALKYAKSYIGLAAWGDWHDGVPKGMTGVFAGRGGRLPNGMYPEDQKYFLVPAAEYDDRDNKDLWSPLGFVIDTTRHQETTKFQ
jgi:hypothetical protein